METTTPEPVRIDKWLWAARFFKTRSLAVEAIEGGHVKVHEQPVKPAHKVKIGDAIQIRREGWTQLIEVKGLSETRGPAAVAQALYLDYSPPKPVRPPAIAVREAGAGRPTKRERRAIDQMRQDSLWSVHPDQWGEREE